MIPSISFAVAPRGIAVGGGGLILLTANMGFTWTRVESGKNRSLISVYLVPGTGYIGGDQVFLKTTYGGMSWNLTAMPFEMNELSF